MVTDRWRSYSEIIHSIEGGRLLGHTVVICQYCACFQALHHLIKTPRSNNRLHARHSVLLIGYNVLTLILLILVLLLPSRRLWTTITMFNLIAAFSRKLSTI
jgi:hypothetical protein